MALLLLVVLSVCAVPPSAAAPGVAAPGAGKREPVPVHLAGIRMIGPDQVLLLLADEKEERAVPIAVGREQGIAIYLGKAGTETPRPMTHDLLVRILKALRASVERVTVTELRQETYFSEIVVRQDDTRHSIDARPSDAIALAVRLGSPIYAAPDLLRPVGGAGRTEVATRPDPRLGLSVQGLDADLAESLGAPGVSGVLVASVREGGPAERAGLRRGDIIQAIDGKPVANLTAYAEAAAGDSLPKHFTVWRDGRTLDL
ncbi:MAG TPA: bifunctional nuclease domain-containing protein [Candidatus Polarisedimenticolia bacterium]|nr:bifunctional nuclease domain-containing protein [Candidatus Polarisedimenticolia bacterium]